MGDDSDSQCCWPFGSLRESCRPDGSCDEGLECTEREETCDELSSRTSGMCDHERECFGHEGDEDVITVACCLPLGTEDYPCRSDGTCNGDLTCVSGMCRQAGGERDYCYEDDSCDEGFECRDDPDEFCWTATEKGERQLTRCCLALDSAHDPCSEDATCEEGHKCIRDFCRPG